MSRGDKSIQPSERWILGARGPAGSQAIGHEVPSDPRVLARDGAAGRQRLQPARSIDVLPGARAADDQIEEQTRIPPPAMATSACQSGAPTAL